MKYKAIIIPETFDPFMSGEMDCVFMARIILYFKSLGHRIVVYKSRDGANWRRTDQLS
jgi:hypothetical protein